MMFKSYGITMYYLMIDTFMRAIKGQTPELRRIAQKQFVLVMTIPTLLSGVAGAPMVGLVGAIFDTLKEDDDEDFKTLMRKSIGDLGTEGLLNEVTGLQLSSRASLSNLLYRSSPVEDQPNRFYRMFDTLGGPVVGMLGRTDRALDLMGQGRSERAMETMMPAFISGPLKAYRYGTEGTRTMRGDPITGEVSPWNIFAQFFGFTPADYARQLEINGMQNDINRAVIEKRSRLLDSYFRARQVEGPKGTGKMAEIRIEMREFSREHPDAAISPETITRSMGQRERNTALARRYSGMIPTRALEREMRRRLSGYGFGITDF